MKASTFSSKGGLAVHKPSSSARERAAFTLIELLVVVATLGVLFAVLLPALAGTQAQSKLTACTARFRQWAISANLYANDNRGWLPSFNPSGGGLYAWDVGTNMLNALYPYGMDVPDYFCPMRPNEWDAANAWSQGVNPEPASPLGHPIQSMADLTKFFSYYYPGELQLNDNYWVPRIQADTSFPIDFSVRIKPVWPLYVQLGLPTCAVYGWPQRIHDIAAPYVPFVSDKAASGNAAGLLSPVVGYGTTDISTNTAHFINGTLIGVNLAFADGHVASHTPSQMRCVYGSNIGSAPYWFY